MITGWPRYEAISAGSGPSVGPGSGAVATRVNPEAYRLSGNSQASHARHSPASRRADGPRRHLRGWCTFGSSNFSRIQQPSRGGSPRDLPCTGPRTGAIEWRLRRPPSCRLSHHFGSNHYFAGPWHACSPICMPFAVPAANPAGGSRVRAVGQAPRPHDCATDPFHHLLQSAGEFYTSAVGQLPVAVQVIDSFLWTRDS